MSFKAIKPLWRGHEYFSVEDAAALLAGFDPTSVEPGGEYFRDTETGLTDSEGISDVQAAFSLLSGAILAGSLPAKLRHRAEPRYCAGLDQYAERIRWQGGNVFLHDSLNGDEFVIDELPDWGRTLVRAADVIAWLAPKGWADGFFITEPCSQGAPIASGSAANSEELESLRQQLEQERAAREAAERRAEKAESEAAELRTALEFMRRHPEAMLHGQEEARPAHLMAVAGLLELLLERSRPPYTQGSAAMEIEARHPDRRGASASQLTKVFAEAKAAAKEADKVAQAKAEARQAAASRVSARAITKT